MNTNELDENKLDKIISVTKPFLGYLSSTDDPISPVIIELLGNLIPNQRIDRIAKFLKILERKFVDLNISSEQMSLNIENHKEYFYLLESGLFNAYRASSDNRLEYIASIIANGLTKEQIQESQYIYLLNILSELNDEEIIWLRFYLEPTLGCDKEFREKHINVLERPRTFIGAPEENLNKAALQDSYLEHLDRLGLIESKIQIDKNTNLPIFNKSGKPEVSSRHTTRLGKMLLKEIGLLDEQ